MKIADASIEAAFAQNVSPAKRACPLIDPPRARRKPNPRVWTSTILFPGESRVTGPQCVVSSNRSWGSAGMLLSNASGQAGPSPRRTGARLEVRYFGAGRPQAPGEVSEPPIAGSRPSTTGTAGVEPVQPWREGRGGGQSHIRTPISAPRLISGAVFGRVWRRARTEVDSEHATVGRRTKVGSPVEIRPGVECSAAVIGETN